MEFLKYCFTIGIIALAFDLIWRLIATVFLLILTPVGVIGRMIKKEQIALGFIYGCIKSLNYYLLASIIFTATLFPLSFTNGYGWFMLYSFTGGTLLGSLIGAGIRGAREKTSNESNSFSVKFDVILLIFSLLLYTTMFFVPQIGATYITTTALKTVNWAIDWVWGLPVIGYILGILGILFILSLILSALGVKPEKRKVTSYTPSENEKSAFLQLLKELKEGKITSYTPSSRDYTFRNFPSDSRGGGSSSSPICISKSYSQPIDETL